MWRVPFLVDVSGPRAFVPASRSFLSAGPPPARVPFSRDLEEKARPQNSEVREDNLRIYRARPVDCAGAHRTPEIFQPSKLALRPQGVLSVKEDERSLPRYHISRLAFGGLEHLHNLGRPCRHQRRAPVVTRLVHISSAGKQDSNMRGRIAPARGEEGSQPILVRGVDLERR